MHDVSDASISSFHFIFTRLKMILDVVVAFGLVVSGARGASFVIVVVFFFFASPSPFAASKGGGRRLGWKTLA